MVLSDTYYGFLGIKIVAFPADYVEQLLVRGQPLLA